MPDMILAGDVGATKTWFALYEDGASPRRPHAEAKLPSANAASLEKLTHEFLTLTRAAMPLRAVFGVAGPVVDNRCEATNLPWIVSGATMSAALGGAEVTLLNDLEAAGFGIGTLGAEDLESLQRGQAETGNRALVAAGTGLGESILVWDGERHRPSPSEGGHADWAPNDALEDELLVWLRARFGHVSKERLLSGPGLADLYRFYSETGRGAEPHGARERFENATDPAAFVTDQALQESNPRAWLVVEKWVECYGAEAGNLALTALAIGGVYVGGGIAPHILPLLRDGRFVRAFNAKGRMKPLLEKIPIAVVLDARSALWGAAAVALGTATAPERTPIG
jgi:glucokinase